MENFELPDTSSLGPAVELAETLLIRVQRAAKSIEAAHEYVVSIIIFAVYFLYY